MNGTKCIKCWKEIEGTPEECPHCKTKIEYSGGRPPKEETAHVEKPTSKADKQTSTKSTKKTFQKRSRITNSKLARKVLGPWGAIPDPDETKTEANEETLHKEAKTKRLSTPAKLLGIFAILTILYLFFGAGEKEQKTLNESTNSDAYQDELDSPSDKGVVKQPSVSFLTKDVVVSRFRRVVFKNLKDMAHDPTVRK